MTEVGDEIVVSWSNGCLQQLIEGDQWIGFSPRQKQQWLQEMNNQRNSRTMVRLQLQQQLVELFFHRSLEGNPGATDATSGDLCFVAGKWVKLLHFQDVVDEARKFV